MGCGASPGRAQRWGADVVNARRESLPGRLDMVSLGEVMLRFDPGAGRVRTARSFLVSEGGGEYNVSRGLRRCFGLNTAIVTALADNEVGLLVEDLILQGGVNTSLIEWVPYDGVGAEGRIGLNFTERGFGVRGAKGVSDRAHSAASHLRPGQIDWDSIFAKRGAMWLHTGGIFSALSESSAATAAEAMAAAKRHGATVSYDLNYRPSLWKSRGGADSAIETNRALMPWVDVLIGNEEDFTACLGFVPPATDAHLRGLDPANFQRMLLDVTAEYDHLQVVATTLRDVHSASVNGWGAVAWSKAAGFCQATTRELDVFDRVGGGDSFASGLIYGLINALPLQECVEIGAAHGALAMTTPVDTSMASLDEVLALAQGVGQRVQR